MFTKGIVAERPIGGETLSGGCDRWRSMEKWVRALLSFWMWLVRLPCEGWQSIADTLRLGFLSLSFNCFIFFFFLPFFSTLFLFFIHSFFSCLSSLIPSFILVCCSVVVVVFFFIFLERNVPTTRDNNKIKVHCPYVHIVFRLRTMTVRMIPMIPLQWTTGSMFLCSQLPWSCPHVPES